MEFFVVNFHAIDSEAKFSPLFEIQKLVYYCKQHFQKSPIVKIRLGEPQNFIQVEIVLSF